MRIILYLFLFISIICARIKKPPRYFRKCFKKNIGRKEYKSLYDRFKKYHKDNSDATFPEYIKENEPELNPLLDECMQKDRKSTEDKAKVQLKRNKKKVKNEYESPDNIVYEKKNNKDINYIKEKEKIKNEYKSSYNIAYEKKNYTDINYQKKKKK